MLRVGCFTASHTTLNVLALQTIMKSILLMWFFASYANLATSQYVDEMEKLLALNRDAYLAGPRTAQRQQVAVQYFDMQWTYLQSSSSCGSNALGNSGKVCIADRSAGGRWPWSRYYRDPIISGRF